MREIDVYINLLLEKGYTLKEREYFLFIDEPIISAYQNFNSRVELYQDPDTNKIHYHVSGTRSRIYDTPKEDRFWDLENDLKGRLREYKINQVLK